MARRIWIIPSTKDEIIANYKAITPTKDTPRKIINKLAQEAIKTARIDAVGLARQDAESANCTEIVWGIPPVLAVVLDEANLPMAFEEPESLPVEEPRDFGKEIDALKTAIKKLK